MRGCEAARPSEVEEVKGLSYQAGITARCSLQWRRKPQARKMYKIDTTTNHNPVYDRLDLKSEINKTSVCLMPASLEDAASAFLCLCSPFSLFALPVQFLRGRPCPYVSTFWLVLYIFFGGITSTAAFLPIPSRISLIFLQKNRKSAVPSTKSN